MPNPRCTIVRTQSSLPPILASPFSPTEQSGDFSLPQVDSYEAPPAHVIIRNVRILCMAFGLALGLMTLSLIMSLRGVSLPELNANNISDAEKVKMLNHYNTYAGGLFSVVGMFCHQMALLLLPVFFLCFTTSAILNENKSFVQKWAPVGATAAISLLLSQGMNAVNVQFSSRIEQIIQVNDLSVSKVEFPFVVTNITNSARIAGIPITDTILRNAIRPSIPNDNSTCSFEYGAPVYNDDIPSIQYGFPLNSWLEYMLPTSVTSEKSINFSVSENLTADWANAVASGWALDDIASLFTIGYYDIVEQFSVENMSYLMYNEIVNSSNPMQMLTNMQHVFFNDRLSDGGFRNISVSEIVIDISTFQLSPQIKFDAVTFEIPVAMDMMHEWLDELPFIYNTSKIGGSYITELSTRMMGDDHVIYLATPDTDFIDKISIEFCPGSSSAVIQSYGQYIAMDEAKLFNGSRKDDATESITSIKADEGSVLDDTAVYSDVGAYWFQMKNVRKVYSITYGNLSWETGDLAQVYDAKCEVETKCNGLHFPLSNNQHVIVDDAHLPSDDNSKLITTTSDISVESLSADYNDSTYHLNLIYPPIYDMASDSLPWNISGDYCADTGTTIATTIIQQHIYSKDPLQPAYTIGLFWLFQNAAVHNVKNPSNTSNRTSGMLDFNGNINWISPHVSMPFTSALMTIVGCLLIMIGGALIHFWSLNQNRQREFRRHALSAHNVASILLNTNQFPPELIRIQTTRAAICGSQEENEDLRSCKIKEIRLVTDSLEYVIEVKV